MDAHLQTTTATVSVQREGFAQKMTQLLRRPQVRRWTSLAVTVPLVAMLNACGGSPTQGSTQTATIVESPTAAATPQEKSVVEIVNQMRSSVVLVRADMPKTVFSGAGRSAGTGIVFNSEGYIITNAHVVQGASSVTIALENNGRERPAKVIAVSACDDLALLKVEKTEDLTPASFGQSSALAAGEEVVALGFPESWTVGDEMSVTSGIISKKSVDLGSLSGLLQTDAVINHGNSGGPLLNMYGEVIGINTLKISNEQTSGMNFAINIDQAMPIIEELQGGTNRDWHGMNLSQAQMQDTGELVLVVDGVQSGSPADVAGIEAGDLLLTLEGAKTLGRNDVCKVVRSHSTGDQLKLELARRSDSGWQKLRSTLLLGVAGDPSANAGSSAQIAPAPAPEPTVAPTPPPSSVSVGPFGQDAIQQARDAYDSLRPGAQELLFETFQSPQTKTRWSRNEDATHAAILHNNIYELMLKQADTLVYEYWQQDGSERQLGGSYIVELDVALAHGTTAAGIAFGGQGSGNGSAFIIYGDGSWQLITFQGGSAENAYTTQRVRSDAIIGGGNVNQVRVLVQGDMTLLYVNHTLVGMVQGLPATSGAVGVAALAREGQLPLGVISDNFRALQLK